MKALTPELEAILKSKFQAAADGFRGRIEIDTGDAAVFLQYTDTWSILQGARNHSPGFEAIDFDDSSWARAPGPFGSAGACGYGISTAWSVNTDLCLRTTVQVPAGLASMSFEFGIDNDCYIYWDGVQTNVTGHEGCVGPADFTMVIPSPSAGPHRLAVRAIDRGDQSYFGIRAIPTDMSETLTFLPTRISIDKSLRMTADQATIELPNEGVYFGSGSTSMFPKGARIRIFEWYGDEEA